MHPVRLEGHRVWAQRGQLRGWPAPFPPGTASPSTAPPRVRQRLLVPQSPEGQDPGTQGLPSAQPVAQACGRSRDTLGHSLVGEELQGPAARRHGTHRVAAALAEAGRGGRLVVDVHRGVGPLGWRGAGRGAEEAAEAASEGTGSEGRPRGSLLCPLPILAPQLTTARWWISSSPGQTDALGTLYRGRGRGARDPLSPCPGRPVPRLHPPTGPCPGQPGTSLARDRVLGSPHGHTGSWPQGGGTPRGSVTASWKGLGTPGPNTPAGL